MTETCRKYLVFTLHERRYAVDLALVAEVEEPPILWPIPGAPACYPGAMNFHGAIVAVMDLAAFFGHPASHALEKVVVLAPGVASLALLVEQVESIVPADQVQCDHTRHSDDRYSSGTLLLADGCDALLLDIVELVRDASSRIAAA